MLDKTMIFSLGEEKDDQIKAGLILSPGRAGWLPVPGTPLLFQGRGIYPLVMQGF